jgi:hypothetical protein
MALLRAVSNRNAVEAQKADVRQKEAQQRFRLDSFDRHCAHRGVFPVHRLTM